MAFTSSLCLLLLALSCAFRFGEAAVGPVILNRVVVDEDYTVQSTDAFVLVNSTNSPVYIFLPPVSAALGRVISILDYGATAYDNHIIIVCDGSDIINNNENMGVWEIATSDMGLQLVAVGNGKWFHWQVT
jgi:hypothetical protein